MGSQRLNRDYDAEVHRLSHGLGADQGSWHSLIVNIALKIRESLQLRDILQTTAEQVHRMLECDRILLYQFQPDWSGQVVVEAVSASHWSLLGRVIQDPCFAQDWVALYQAGRVVAIDNLETADITPCHAQFLAGFHVRANLVVPILHGEQLWGLLIAHSCTGPRPWQRDELMGLQQIAVHVGIAINQAALIEELQAAKAELEARNQQVEAQLQVSQTQLAQLAATQATVLRIFYETSPLMMGVVETSATDILHVSQNPATLKFFQTTEASISGKWASQLGVPAPILSLWLTHYHQSRQQRQPVQFDYEHPRAGAAVWLLVTVSYLGLADSGRPRFSYVVQDISERKRLEAERERAEAHQRQAEQISHELKLLENIFDLILAGYWDWHIQAGEEYLSPGFKRMFGYQDHELPNLPSTWQQLIFPEDLDKILASFERHVESHGEVPLHEEVRYRHKDGSTVWVICSGKVIEWDAEGNPLRMIGCHIDITERKRAEETLRKSEATNRALVEAIPDFLVRMRQDGLQVEVINQGAVHCLCPPGGQNAINGIYISEFMPENITRERIGLAQRAVATGQIQRQEYEFTDQGRTYYEEARITPLWDEDVLIVVRDITHQKQAELALKDAKDQLELFIQATSEGFWDWNLVTNEIYFSPRWKEMLGYTDSELENTFETWELVISPEDRMVALQLIEDYNSGKIDCFSMTQRFRHKNGDTVYVFSRAIHLKDDQGQVVRMVGSHLDLTPMIAMQTALRTSEMQLSGILNSSLDGIMAFRATRDPQGRIVDFEWLLSNPTACEMIERPEQWLIGKCLLEEMPGNLQEGLFDQYVQVVETGEPIQRQFYYNHEGIDCWFELIAVKLGDGFAVTFRNITAIKQSEQALQQANQRLEEQIDALKQRNEEMVLLSETSDFLQACLTIEEACAVITSLVEPLFPDCSGGIFITYASRNRVENVASWGSDLCSQTDFYAHDCWGLRRGRPHCVQQQRSRLRCKHIQGRGSLAATLCIPMIAQGETLGLFYLSAAQPQALPEAKQQLARALAEQVALAIANLRLRETLKHQSIRDPLTGLFNRRYLEECLRQEIARAHRHQHPVSVIMLDVDHFKEFNDTHGHAAGDYVLEMIGALLREQLRSSDIPCRYGGEEMTLVLPEVVLEDAYQIAENLRLQISQIQLSYRNQSLDTLTASFGIACFPIHGSSGTPLIKAADAALYRAKAAGRNQTVTASVGP